MKSICFLLQNHYDFDIRVRRKAEALVAAGYLVDVYALRGQNGPKNYALNGVNVYTISLGKQRGSLARYAFEYAAFFMWALLRLTVQMRRKRYAVVDVNTLPDFLIFAGIFARFMGAKLLLDMHEITPEFYMSKYGIEQNSLPIRVLTHLEKISFDFADHVLTINEPIQDLLAKRGLRYEKCTIVMNSADEANFAVPKNVSVPSADFVMMYHGTLTKLYGLDIAIEAFATVKDQMPGAEFWILGGGTEAPALKKLVQDRGLESRVKLMGSVRPSEIPAWLNKCDLGILPLRRDVFLDFASPNKLAEFIIMGKPVIISRLKAVQRYFSDDALAFCEPNDTASLAREMSNVYKDSARRARMVANARSEYMPIRWDVMKERYLAIVDHLADAVPEVEQSRSGRAII